LYTALDRLRADKLIEVDREEIVEGRLRRYYRLTPSGTKALSAEAARLHANATAAFKRLRLAGGMATSVRGAIRLMCVGAATSVALLITLVVTTGNVRSAILAQNPTFTAAQWHGVLVEITIKEFWAPVAIALWPWLAWANGRGRDRARLE
jgi:Transcriptional regulator PadR-like family